VKLLLLSKLYFRFIPFLPNRKPNEYASSILYWVGVCFVSVGRYKRQKSLTVTVFSMY